MLKVKDKEFELYLSERQLRERIQVLGGKLSEDYKSKDPVVLGVLNGAFMFLSDLMKEIDAPLQMAFIKIASYEATRSTGQVKEVIGLSMGIGDRHVIIVEDIVDTGRSMDYLIKKLKEHSPSSISVVSLLLKPEALESDVVVDYVGFEIPNKFVVGYGLDYDGYGRNLKEIYQLK
ncbi:hypoxanthine phosphoribosyltransferase [Echinicola strongylocentroti]|uniref:Hypoxanthine phosphoribosyltransferase n=1 Tax=Echinicola strongylocentroti TaxID=1795355 RepID=A0A2Z4IHX2_9BACT|nr:hypoxanthine phosphoribosyltransferase [Echinicola strongylocentroti]AWW30307.1 hypoxanthine phosphoribosyltransferase [Echinicola strongylocentroti]